MEKKISHWFWVAVLTLGIFTAPRDGRCMDKMALLQRGATPGDVIRILGEPTDREEHETKRELIWRYPKSQVVFHDGVLISWQEVQTPQESHAQQMAARNRAAIDEARRNSRSQTGVDDIISEILKEVPTDNSPSNPGPGAGGPPGVGPPPPIVPEGRPVEAP